jgi:hypothetical protein
MTTAESLKGLSEWVNMHSRALGLTFTGYFIIAFGAGYATHLKCEARRVEMHKAHEAVLREMLREADEKHKAHEAVLREMDEKHEAVLRKANDAK